MRIYKYYNILINIESKNPDSSGYKSRNKHVIKRRFVETIITKLFEKIIIIN